ncbi:hypothetical protein [Sinorhizobium fredii]|uniref:Uncharacterized protein n=1 Tax=Rhizobium fredii TaxID=380 RepID=A0A2A6M6C8_RHIFR|nr:hypothetical protein [Sinorhizobium fredii]PDT50413.1 hypothetical protein CO661_01885 [Sinorhizobium fredii]
MELTTTTPIAVLVAALLVGLGPVRALPALFAVLPLGSAAAFNLPAVGNSSILVSDIAACTFIAVVLASRRHVEAIVANCRPGAPGFFLASMLAVGLVVTLFAPRIFAGTTDVFAIGRQGGEVGVVIRPLGPGSGNITQGFRLSLGVLVFLTCAAVLKPVLDDRRVVLAFLAATTVNVALAAYDFATYAVSAPELMAWLRTANYTILDHHEIAGVKRIIGDFPEASAFGYFSVGLFGFWCKYWLTGGRMRHGVFVLAAALAMVLLSGSSAAFVALAAFLTITFAGILLATDLRRIPRRIAVAVGLCVLLLPFAAAVGWILLQTSSGFSEYFDRLLFSKLESDSAIERGSWNSQALQNFVETWMLGAGLGSVRASNFVIAVLSSIGVAGAVLYVGFFYALARAKAPRLPNESAAITSGCRAACLILVLKAFVTKSTPDLEVPFFLYAGAAFAYASFSISKVDASLLPRPAKPAWMVGRGDLRGMSRVRSRQ